MSRINVSKAFYLLIGALVVGAIIDVVLESNGGLVKRKCLVPQKFTPKMTEKWNSWTCESRRAGFDRGDVAEH